MHPRPAFTLIEVLIVVVILGVLSAIVVPQFSTATKDAASTATLDQLTKVRQALDIYYVRNNATRPTISEGGGSAAWGELVGPGYMGRAPFNLWVDPANRDIVAFGDLPDTQYQPDIAWIYDPDTGSIWAGGFDGDDQPFPKP